MVETLMIRPQDDTSAEDEVASKGSPRRSAGFVLRRTMRRFLQDRGAASASALTLQAVLTVLAGVVALLGVLGVVDGTDWLSAKVEDVLGPVLSADLLDRLSTALREAPGAAEGWAVLASGAVAVLLGAMAYVASVRAATNLAWQVGEGRPGWRLVGLHLLLGLAALVLGGVVVALLATSGPMTDPVARSFGLRLVADELAVWGYAVWPLVAVVLIVLVAVLHRATPNVRFGRTRLITPGSFVSIALFVGTGGGLAAYLAWYPSWNTTVGTVVAVAAVLLWLWLVHAALVLGAELDAELERGRELRGGRPAEERLQVPVRDDRGLTRPRRREHRAVERMREIRLAAAAHGDPDDRPFGRR